MKFEVRNNTDLRTPDRYQEARTCKTKPISRRGPVGHGTGKAGRWCCTNKPNCPKRGTEAVSRLQIANLGTDLPPPACSGRLRQTNPILGLRPRAAVVLMGETPTLRNALRRLPAGAGMTLLRTGLLRQTNPICARAIWRVSIVRTRSCDQWDARAASGEQSQLGRSCRFEVSSVNQGNALVQASNFTPYTSNSAEGRSRQTNPIWGGVASLKFQVSSEPTRSAGALPFLTSHFTLKTSNFGLLSLYSPHRTPEWV